MTIPIITLGRLGDLPLVSVTDYTLEGPSSATVGFASDQFVVALAAGTLGSPVRVTPSDGGAGGSFFLAAVSLTDGIRSRSFVYTPAGPGTVTISVTNDDALTDPAPIVLTVSDAPAPDETTHGPIVMLRPAPASGGGRP